MEKLNILWANFTFLAGWATIAKYLEEEGFEFTQEDLSRISPLQHRHINFMGHYSFTMAEGIRQGKLRPLHDPEEEYDRLFT